MLPELITPIPGPRSRELAVELRAHESRNVTYVSPGFPVFWERAHGVNVWDVDGNRFLDLTSGFGVASLGYTPEKIVAAARDQNLAPLPRDGRCPSERRKRPRFAGGYRKSLLEMEARPAGKIILTNSGSEAVEAALKTAWLATKRRGVLRLHRQLPRTRLRRAHRDGPRSFFVIRLPRNSPTSPLSCPSPICQHCPFGATGASPPRACPIA